MNIFTTILHTLSSTLLVPVILLLIGLFGWSLLTLGDFLRETLERCRSDNKQAGVTEKLKGRLAEIVWINGFEEEAMLTMDDLLDECEDRMTAKLEKTDLSCRVAPILGLMGTLIPLGPGLMALSGGDRETLENKLVLAFTLTVIGLATSAISLLVTTVRRRWYKIDIRDAKRMARRLIGQSKG